MSGLLGVVWDCDGTLVDSEPLALAEWEAVLDRYGYQATDADWSLLVGRPFDVFYDYFSQRADLPPQEAFMSEFVDRLFPVLRAGLRAFDDAASAARFLGARRIPMAVASSSHRERLDLMLAITDLAGLFPATVSGDDVEVGKPAPDIYEAAATALDLAPTQCLAIEDSVPGIMSARAAGMTVVAVARGERSHADLLDADVVVQALAGDELLALLDETVPG